jgi:hypothetical protein
MIEFLSEHMVMDRRKTKLFFIMLHEGMELGFSVNVDDFMDLFSVPIQKAMDNNTDPMDEIRAFDPENKLGYNDLIV